MEITKSARLDELSGGGNGDMELINSFAKATLKPEDVYIFSVRLCDNEIDRDYERFSEEALAELGELFTGATGISDHEWSSEKQVARIFRTEVVTEKGRLNSLGEPYVYLRAWAYVLRGGRGEELICDIEGGIKREVSVGCSMGSAVCSICGEETGSTACSHIKGREYGGRLCFAELRDARDAYEWSFVAVPAQREAGVMKRFGGGTEPESHERLGKMAAIGERYMAALRKEVKKLGLLADPELGETLGRAIEVMDIDELEAFKGSFERQLDGRFPPVTQLPGRDRATRFDGSEYQI